MFWGSQSEDLEHRKMTEGQNSERGDSNGVRGDSTGERGDSTGERGDSNDGRGDSNDVRRDSNDGRRDSTGDRRDSRGDRRDSKGRLLPNPVLCCESLSIRATAQVHPALLLNNMNRLYTKLCQWVPFLKKKSPLI